MAALVHACDDEAPAGALEQIDRANELLAKAAAQCLDALGLQPQDAAGGIQPAMGVVGQHSDRCIVHVLVPYPCARVAPVRGHCESGQRGRMMISRVWWAKG